ncbi:dolichyl-diphosphooligosaccharide---protein glycotransferase [Synchytrium microbalum]|uniref:Dolichyl-diphosphooligosaccharide--protein glycosyltransferase subunit WBP1 n=1 Tax=Synchytrium microbalum TaxID=1806994 RepID=A0A507C0P8_9FUNG|nr:dolichyl-diphosphooligosaccharide---protein glycotransferase [Synchytrium microbalum]TPX33262.1 dolichyl-diphosphooligosaccharide---protein glycotransferase [Synchytrium microbalum]
MRLYIVLSLLICTICYSHAKSAQGQRVLMILNDVKDSNSKYSKFTQSLSQRGFSITTKAATDSSLALIKYEEKVADHLIILSSEAESYGNDLTVGAIIEYVNAGGNVLVAGSTSISETLRDLALEFSADFDEPGRNVLDAFSSPITENPARITSSHYIANPHILPSSITASTILFEGVGHRLTGRNPFIIPVLTGSASSYTGVKDGGVDASSVLGTNNVLVSALQARNNARVIFAGSALMFSDELWDAKVDGKPVGNAQFAIELTKWAFHEKGVLKVRKFCHHEKNGTQQLGTYHQGPTYRIKDYFTYEIDISKYESDEWKPFTTNDLLLEAIMIDPYVRIPLKPTTSHTPSAYPDAQYYEATFQLPDVYGVFTFKVDYKRHGLTWLLASDTVPIRPFRHDEYPRFIAAANPYYVNSFSLMIGFLLVCLLWMYHREPLVKEKAA